MGRGLRFLGLLRGFSSRGASVLLVVFFVGEVLYG